MKWLKFKSTSKGDQKLNKARTITAIVGTIIVVVAYVAYVIWGSVKSSKMMDNYLSALGNFNK